VKTAQARNIQIVTAGNQDDGLLQPRACGIPVDGDISSQWVGGATVLKFNLPKPRSFPWTCVKSTHSVALSDPSTVAKLAGAIWAGGAFHSGPNLLTSHVAVQQPALYVFSGVMLSQQLWSWPHFPASIGIDNHNGLTGLRWTRHSLATASARGIMFYDLCTRSCAGGPVLQTPVELFASHPTVCTVQVFDLHVSAWRLQRAYVYNTLSSRLVRSAGVPPWVSRELRFQPACKAGTA
jgi:hypothetical protein